MAKPSHDTVMHGLILPLHSVMQAFLKCNYWDALGIFGMLNPFCHPPLVTFCYRLPMNFQHALLLTAYATRKRGDFAVLKAGVAEESLLFGKVEHE